MPCSCIACDCCNGTGNIWVDMISGLPTVHCDDLDELETCEECGGSGVAEVCDECRDLLDDGS